MQLKHLAIAGFASYAVAQNATNMTLVQALNSSSQLSLLNGIIGAPGQAQLVQQLANLNNITILAPDNNAITAFLQAANASGMQPTDAQISAVLSYHVLNGTYANFSSMPAFIRTALTQPQFANVTGGQRVEVVGNTAYSGLKANSTVNSTALNFTGGVVHVINRVLTVPPPIGQTLTAFNLTSAYGALNQTQLLSAAGSLRDLTVFVPNNAAFRAIGSALGTLNTQQLAGILSYHVINGTVAYSSMLSNMSVPTLAGANVTITVRNSSSVFVNGARVVIPDVLVANGVVHVIDEVLSPNNTAGPAANATAGVPAYSGASSATDEPFTSGQPRPTSAIDTGSIQATATSPSSSSSSGGAWAPKATGAIGAAALGGLALLMQL